MTESIGITTQSEFVERHATKFYDKFPSRADFEAHFQARIDHKLSRATSRTDTALYLDNRDMMTEFLAVNFYDDNRYRDFLTAYFDSKLRLDGNMLFKSYVKQDKGITNDANGNFKANGQDVGRKIIQNLSYRDIFSCQKAKPTDITGVEAFDNVIDMKHLLYPAFINNVLEGKFDDPYTGRKDLYSMIIKFISIFSGKASVFNPGTYAHIMKTFAPHAKTSVHFVGSWATPALAAASLRLDHQVIIDVIPRIAEVGNFINKNFIPKSLVHKGTKLDFIICPSERLDERLDFGTKYKDYFDIQMWSPVYFDTELYSTIESDAGEQSVDSFPTYDAWINGYYRETVRTAFKVMKPGAPFITVISDFEYDDPKTKQTYYISEDMKRILIEEGFVHSETRDLVLTSGSAFTSKAAIEKRRESRKTLFSEHVHVHIKPKVTE